jgi:hypothetical protein
MSVVTTVNAHIKVRIQEGVLAYERCEDFDCNVDPAGVASCGRDACPSCGCSGANVTANGPDRVCSCGHWWAPGL